MNTHAGSKVVIATVGLVILAGLLSGAATLWHTRNISSEYDRAIKKELEQKGLAYAYTATVFLDALGDEALPGLNRVAELGVEQSKDADRRVAAGNFANAFVDVQVLTPNSEQGYQTLYDSNTSGEQDSPAPAATKAAKEKLVSKAATGGVPVASVVERDENLIVAFPFTIGDQPVIAVGTISAAEEFSFFAEQKKDVFLQGIVVSSLIIAVTSAIGIVVSTFVARDLTSRRRVEETLRKQARHDLLTGTLNHVAIVDELRQVMATAGSTSHAVAMIDVDELKALNDTHGHQLGDAVLVAVARALAQDGVIVGRYGGDEFVAVIPGADRSAAERYRQRVTDRFAIAEVRGSETGALVPVAASIGLAVFPDDARTITELIAVSDFAMYAAKRQRPVGRTPDDRTAA
ncbi:MAG: GGDEF domain-containing protein [Dehalococcoidia bacterium]